MSTFHFTKARQKRQTAPDYLLADPVAGCKLFLLKSSLAPFSRKFPVPPSSHADLMTHAVAFSWMWMDPDSPQRPSEVRLEARRRHGEDAFPSAWAVVLNGSWVLNREGQWEDEPSPSSRTPEFLARTRWGSPDEALAFVETTLPGWASQGEMPDVAAWRAEWAARRESAARHPSSEQRTR